MMVIDPSMRGCDVWYQDMVQHLNCGVDESIARILAFLQRHKAIEELKNKNYYWDTTDDGKRYIVQYKTNIPIYIDVTAHGKFYGDEFTERGIPYIQVKGRRFL